MSNTKTLAIASVMAVIAASVAMVILYQFGSEHCIMDTAGVPFTHMPMQLPGGTGWFMAVGPLSMMLWFGGIVGVALALVRAVSKTA